MSTYDKAYCKSLDKYISAKEANEYTLSGNILETEDLFCSKNCPVILTCINRKIDYNSDPSKISPYYANRKHGQIHSLNCDRKHNFVEKNKKGKNRNTLYYFSDDSQNLIFDFDLSTGLMPAKNSTTAVTTTNGNQTQTQTKINGKSNNSHLKNQKHRMHHTRLLKQIVQLWEAYNEFGLNQKLYDKNGHRISWDDLFVHVQGVVLDSTKYYIYYGQAFCSPIDNDTIRLSFAGFESTLGDIKGKARVLLHRKRFEKDRAKGLFEKLFKYAKNWSVDYQDSSSYFTLYYLGKFIKMTPKKKQPYISFDYNDTNFTHSIYLTPNNS